MRLFVMTTLIKKSKAGVKKGREGVKLHSWRFDQHVDKKLKRRVKMYLIIALILFVIALYELWISHYSILYILIVFIGWLVLGFFFTRMFHLKRNPDDEMITSRIDRLGIVVLVLYIGFAVARRFIIQEFVPNHSAYIAVYVALLSWLMFGRYIGLQRKIFTILQKHLVKKS